MGARIRRGTCPVCFAHSRTRSSTTNVSFLFGVADQHSSVVDAIQRHEDRVFHGAPYADRCIRCEQNSGFSCHERRKRTVRVIVDATVQVFHIVLARLRCLHCRRVFVDYPDFLLPYRRYASDCLLPLARQYLEQDETSYQQAVTENGRVIGYVTPPNRERIDERALHRSTLWRFVQFLGLQIAGLEMGMRLLDDQDPIHATHRFTGAVAPRKFRSERRQQTLRTARRLLKLIDRWNQVFTERFFPRFATKPRDS